MKNYSYKISIPAPEAGQADTKVEALMKLASHLKAEELKAFANVVVSDPAKVTMAKSFLGI